MSGETSRRDLLAARFGPTPDPVFQVGRRRWMLQTGLCGLAGLSLPFLLKVRAEAAGTGKVSSPLRSVIQIWLSGGPSQIDMWDMKPEMPSEIRGPFQPISTCVPGVQDRYTQEAYNLVLGGAAQKAFDLGEEPEEVRNRYGRDSLGEKALLARRLVEAGVTFVTMSDAWGHWDHHGDEVQWGGIVKGLTPMLPVLDRGLTALVNDLESRGLLESTLVVVIGEFGRSPVMTKTAGRDHWPNVMSFVLAGGGFSGGRVIGATDRRGGTIQETPLGPGDLAATVFRHLDVEPSAHWVNPSGRPVPLVEQGTPLQTL